MANPFYIVDVFAERPYSGNPLAVVVATEPLTDPTMQAIAAETNFSETSFVIPTPDPDGAYRVRLFTPAREIAFAGHPILGSAWVIRHHVARQAIESVRLSLAGGEIPVHFEVTASGLDEAWFLAPPMSHGPHCPHDLIATAVGLDANEIEQSIPIQQFSAGTSALIVPLRSLDALRRCNPDRTTFAALKAAGYPPLVYLFCHQTRYPENDLSARFFFDAHGVREDPATGNGAAFLGAYLLKHSPSFGSCFSLRIEQGYEVRRPSVVRMRVNGDTASPEIRVGGPIVPTVAGYII